MRTLEFVDKAKTLRQTKEILEKLCESLDLAMDLENDYKEFIKVSSKIYNAVTATEKFLDKIEQGK